MNERYRDANTNNVGVGTNYHVANTQYRVVNTNFKDANATYRVASTKYNDVECKLIFIKFRFQVFNWGCLRGHDLLYFSIQCKC